MNYKTLAYQFAECFTNKDAEGIGMLLNNDFVLYDPGISTSGKNAVVDLFRTQFEKIKNSSYQILYFFQNENTTILEFKIKMDENIYNGVDLIEWENNKMKELRCYFNPPEKLTKEVCDTN